MGKSLLGLIAILLLVSCGGETTQLRQLAPASPPLPSPAPSSSGSQESATSETAFTLSSPAFADNAMIPTKYTCDGAGINPPLRITGIPTGTNSLGLIVDDPDAPKGTFTHWVVWNIPQVGEIAENSGPGTMGINSAGKNAYAPPCPPSGTHRYVFTLYAADATLTLPKSAGKAELDGAMRGHTIAKAQLIGTYRRG